jgi:PIN domain nuclease of toxin-antitoxin system
MSSVSQAPLLLDTHYWIWMESGDSDRVPQRLRLAIQEAAGAGVLMLSAISVWELGFLEAKGRIQLSSPCEE